MFELSPRFHGLEKRVDKIEAEGNEIGQAATAGKRAPTLSSCNRRAKRIVAQDYFVDPGDQGSRPWDRASRVTATAS
jgi:hypothetical protein